MKALIKFFILMLAIVSMASCSKFGLNNGDKEEPAGKLVKSIIGREDGCLFTFEFSYDANGRVVNAKYQEDSWGSEWREIQYVYDNDQMQVIYSDNDPETCYFDNGKLMKVSCDGDSNLFTYTQGSSKPKSMFFDNKSGHSYDSYTDHYIWDSTGNLVQIVYDGGYEEDISYLDIENKCNIDVLLLIYPHLRDAAYFLDRNVFHSIMSTNLPSRIRYSDDTYADEISYSFDSDGYPTEIRKSYNGEVWKVFKLIY